MASHQFIFYMLCHKISAVLNQSMIPLCCDLTLAYSVRQVSPILGATIVIHHFPVMHLYCCVTLFAFQSPALAHIGCLSFKHWKLASLPKNCPTQVARVKFPGVCSIWAMSYLFWKISAPDSVVWSSLLLYSRTLVSQMTLSSDCFLAGKQWFPNWSDFALMKNLAMSRHIFFVTMMSGYTCYWHLVSRGRGYH